MVSLTRFAGNPILSPLPQSNWEKDAVFNGSITGSDKKYHLLYRAQSGSLSTIGIAESSDRINFHSRRQLIVPELDWEKFGCEDPRVTRLENTYYIFYTALSAFPPDPASIKIGVALTDNLRTIKEKHQITPFNSKAMALFPEKINGKIYAVLTVDTDLPPAKICLATFDNPAQIWDKTYWDAFAANLNHYSLTVLRSPHDHVEVGASPIKTTRGWLLIYCYISNYLTINPTFAIEALLLDSTDPSKIIGRTEGPLLTPQEDYELYGKVQNVIFPSGAIICNNDLGVYYGAADTTVCLATCNLDQLLSSLSPGKKPQALNPANIILSRFSGNPIISPIYEHSWEDRLTFNPAAVYLENKIHLLYRAVGQSDTSVLGYAATKDGVNIDERLNNPVYVPREDFEKKLGTSGHSGCEDPRITLFNDKLFMCYTAYDGKNPTRVALTSISVPDFCAKRWNWKKPRLISPPGLSDKNACIFPDKVNGKYVFFHRLQHCIWIDFVDDLNFGDSKWLGGNMILRPKPNTWYSEKIGIGPPPIKTSSGWLLIYHGLSKEDKTYRLGAALLRLENPLEVISLLEKPILEPNTPYENNGLRPGTVFSCGAAVFNDNLFIYYGGADQVICVAAVSVKNIINQLLSAK